MKYPPRYSFTSYELQQLACQELSRRGVNPNVGTGYVSVEWYINQFAPQAEQIRLVVQIDDEPPKKQDNE